MVFFVVDAELGSVCFVGIMWFEHCACVYLDCLSFWKFRCFFFFLAPVCHFYPLKKGKSVALVLLKLQVITKLQETKLYHNNELCVETQAE